MNEKFNQLESAYKDFWKKPEGTTGMIFGVIGVGILGWALYKLLPYINFILQNTITALISGVFVLVIIWILLDGSLWRNFKLAYKLLMRKLTGIIIQIDPIGILRENIKKMTINRKAVKEQITVLHGQKNKLQNQLAANKASINQEMQLAQEAKKQEKKGQFLVSSRQAGRLNKQTKTFGEMLIRINALIERLTKVDEFLDFLIKDTTFEVNTMEENYKTVTAGSNAIKAAMRVITGNADDNELTDAATQFLLTDIASKQGLIDSYLITSQEFIDTMDLQNGVYQQAGLDMLDSFEKEMDSFLEKGEEEQKMKELPEHTSTFTIPLNTTPINNYDRVFNNKKEE